MGGGDDVVSEYVWQTRLGWQGWTSSACAKARRNAVSCGCLNTQAQPENNRSRIVSRRRFFFFLLPPLPPPLPAAAGGGTSPVPPAASKAGAAAATPPPLQIAAMVCATGCRGGRPRGRGAAPLAARAASRWRRSSVVACGWSDGRCHHGTVRPLGRDGPASVAADADADEAAGSDAAGAASPVPAAAAAGVPAPLPLPLVAVWADASPSAMGADSRLCKGWRGAQRARVGGSRCLYGLGHRVPRTHGGIRFPRLEDDSLQARQKEAAFEQQVFWMDVGARGSSGARRTCAPLLRRFWFSTPSSEKHHFPTVQRPKDHARRPFGMLLTVARQQTGRHPYCVGPARTRALLISPDFHG